MARINAILKRTRPTDTADLSPCIQVGKLVLRPEQHQASWNEQPVNLTATEFAILLLMAKGCNRVYNRDHIMQNAYEGHVYVSDRTIDSHIRHIRQKFAEYGCNAIIDTVHGVGYKLAPCQ